MKILRNEKKNRRNAAAGGILLLAAIAAGVSLVVLTTPILDAAELVEAIATNRIQILVGSLLQFVMAAACAGIAIAFYPALRRHSPALALGAVGFRLIEASLFIVSTGALLTALSISLTASGSIDAGSVSYEVLISVCLTIRDWLSAVLGAAAFCLGAMLYYGVFFRSRLIPRWLAAWGWAAAALHLASALLVMFGMDSFSPLTLILNLPIFLNELVLGVWLIVKGFNPAALPPDAN